MDEAAAWFARLGQKRITSQEVREFSHWRDDPANDAAYSTIEKEWDRKRGRFVALPDSAGFSVIDTWTGEPAEFANAHHVGVSEVDATDLADLLNRRASQGDDGDRLN